MNCGQTICWDCEKSCTKECSWAATFHPVSGWDATETKNGFCVNSCPEFLRDSYGHGQHRTDWRKEA